jgi:hypothetical protein
MSLVCKSNVSFKIKHIMKTTVKTAGAVLSATPGYVKMAIALVVLAIATSTTSCGPPCDPGPGDPWPIDTVKVR